MQVDKESHTKMQRSRTQRQCRTDAARLQAMLRVCLCGSHIAEIVPASLSMPFGNEGSLLQEHGGPPRLDERRLYASALESRTYHHLNYHKCTRWAQLELGHTWHLGLCNLTLQEASHQQAYRFGLQEKSVMSFLRLDEMVLGI